MIGVRPLAESPELTAVDILGRIADVRTRNRLVIEQTRASLGELRVQKSRMHDALSSMRNNVELARTLREGTGLRPHSPSKSAPKGSISQREIDVLKEVAAGLPNKQVAIRLGISQRTVRNHMTEIFTKLRVHNRTEAVLRALRLGLLIG